MGHVSRGARETGRGGPESARTAVSRDPAARRAETPRRDGGRGRTETTGRDAPGRAAGAGPERDGGTARDAAAPAGTAATACPEGAAAGATAGAPTWREVPAPAVPARADVSALARAIERIAVMVSRGEGGPAVTLRLGLSLTVTMASGPSGIELALHAARGLSPLAEAELPGLVAALQARHIRVARAGVLAGAERGERSLTAPRRSDRTAGPGTVAKW